jgi:hypothetical protein
MCKFLDKKTPNSEIRIGSFVFLDYSKTLYFVNNIRKIINIKIILICIFGV